MTEEWRSIIGFEGYYEVSSLGRVRSVARGILKTGYVRPVMFKSVIMVQRLDKDGYPRVGLRRDGKLFTQRVHQIMATVFLGSAPSPKHMVCHRQGLAAGNTVANIYWGTQQDNHDDRVRHGTSGKGEGNPAAVLTSEQVKALRARRSEVPSLSKLAAEFGLSKSQTWAIINRKSWNHI